MTVEFQVVEAMLDYDDLGSPLSSAKKLASAAVKRSNARSAERAAAGEWTTPRGELVVTAPMVFGRLHMLPAVVAFLAAFPEVNVRLVLSDRNLGLAEDHVDVALRIGALPDSSLRATRVGEVRRVAVVSPEFCTATVPHPRRRTSHRCPGSYSRVSTRIGSGCFPLRAAVPRSPCRSLLAWPSTPSRHRSTQPSPASVSPGR